MNRKALIAAICMLSCACQYDAYAPAPAVSIVPSSTPSRSTSSLPRYVVRQNNVYAISDEANKAFSQCLRNIGKRGYITQTEAAFMKEYSKASAWVSSWFRQYAREKNDSDYITFAEAYELYIKTVNLQFNMYPVR